VTGLSKSLATLQDGKPVGLTQLSLQPKCHCSPTVSAAQLSLQPNCLCKCLYWIPLAGLRLCSVQGLSLLSVLPPLSCYAPPARCCLAGWLINRTLEPVDS